MRKAQCAWETTENSSGMPGAWWTWWAMMSGSRMAWATSTYLDFILHDQMSICEDNSYSNIKIG